MEKKPNITFFCEMPADELKELFTNNQVIRQLLQLNANVSLGLLDFSSDRASVVKKLTRAGIPVTAWLLLPKEQGYWTSLDTVSETVHCYRNIKVWTEKNGLNWAAVGLDIEPRLDRMKLFGKNWTYEIPDLIKRLFLTNKYQKQENDLRALVNQIRADGYPVETYNFPFVIEERKADSNILSKLLGTPALEADREVLMLYSSFFTKNGDAILWSYAHQAQGIGLGSTGGGVELDGGEPLREMRWIDLRRDLLIAQEFSQHIYIFSLEGSMRNNYLERLINFDWSGPIELPKQSGQKITLLRKILQAFLWIFSHPVEIFLSLITLKRLLSRKEK
jgi:hypothetical protein